MVMLKCPECGNPKGAYHEQNCSRRRHPVVEPPRNAPAADAAMSRAGADPFAMNMRAITAGRSVPAMRDLQRLSRRDPLLRAYLTAWERGDFASLEQMLVACLYDQTGRVEAAAGAMTEQAMRQVVIPRMAPGDKAALEAEFLRHFASKRAVTLPSAPLDAAPAAAPPRCTCDILTGGCVCGEMEAERKARGDAN